MSWVSSPDASLPGGWLSSQHAGLGATGAVIDAASSGGESGAGPLYGLGLSGAAEYYWRVTAAPGSGSLVIYEDGTFGHTGAADGAWLWAASVYTDGVLSHTLTITDTFGSVAPPPQVVSGPFTNPATRHPLPFQLIDHVLIISIASPAIVLSQAGLTTDDSARLTVANSALTAGTTYLMLAFDSDGANVGVKRVTAT